MSSTFNPYHVWLELTDCLNEPNYFELLRLEETEDNAKTIAAAADRAASRVRRCRPGEHATEWAALLDKISLAKQCLIDPGQRSDYRRSLEGKRKGSSRSPLAATSATVPIRHTVDPNMYPPGLAPATAPGGHSPVAKGPATAPIDSRRSADSWDNSTAPPASYNAPATEAGPQSPYSPNVPVDPQAAVTLPSQTTAGVLPMSPAGVPYLQPVDPANLDDPMRPVVPAMALPPLDYAGAMAAVPFAGNPMAAVPLSMPSGPGTIPTAQALPPGATTYPLTTNPEGDFFWSGFHNTDGCFSNIERRTNF